MAINQSRILPNEIVDEVFKYSSVDTLAHICCTSKALNKRFTKQLYENVDLMHGKGCPCAISDDEDCYTKQTRFLKTLKTQPGYANYVKTFKWTFVSYGGPYSLPFLPSYSKSNPFGVWEVFQMLTEVTSVDVAEDDSCDEFRDLMPTNLFLFPKAVSVKFSGHLLNTVIDSFLPTNRISQLQHLHLEDFRPEDQELVPKQAAIYFLNGLIGKLIMLKTLTIVDYDGDLDDPRANRPTKWAAYARLLGSVKETLETLYFESYGWWKGFWDGSSRIHDPQLYREGIQRILDDGNWPRLRKVTILPPKRQPKKQEQGPTSK